MKWNIRENGARGRSRRPQFAQTPVSAADVEQRAMEIGRELLKSRTNTRPDFFPPGSGPTNS